MSNKKIAILTSTNRDSRSGIKVAEWVLSQAQKSETSLEFELVDIVDLPFFNEKNLPGQRQYESQALKDWSARIEPFDGYVIALGEYNHMPPAPIKNALDSLFHEWSRKVVGFVGYGSNGAESSIMFMRPFTSYLNMMPIRETIRIIKFHEALDENGVPKDEYVLGDIAKFVAELEWWAKALKDARRS
ncbi:MAG TPA: NAD(P)H-dependent oxidoreductase [Candidatus Saccharimonadales bacterium]